MSFADSLMAGLSLVWSFEAFLALFAGICIGVVGGAIPGLSATMAVALTLPLGSLSPLTYWIATRTIWRTAGSESVLSEAASA